MLERGESVNDDTRSHFNWSIAYVLSRFGWDGHGKQRGKWTDIRCPFHDDRHIGNAGFNEVLNTFKCQACGVAGNSVTLVMKALGRSERDAVEWLGQPNDPLPAASSSTWRYG